LAGDRIAQHGDLVFDVALGGRALEGHLRAHLLGLFLGTVLDRLPELVLEAFGHDGDVGLLTTAALATCASAAAVVVGASGQADGHGRGGRSEQNFTSTHCCSPSVSALCGESDGDYAGASGWA